jgi:plastocyanin
MIRRVIFAATLLPMIAAAACGGYGDSSPSAPGPATPPEGAIVINVVGINGSLSFSPNPATIPPGQTVVWHNVDTTTHHVVLNDGKLDTGNISAGRFSAPMTLPAAGPYHCSIHPEMVGTLTTGQ